MKFYRFREFL